MDWHPIRANTYPAQQLARLTTERLLEKVCIGEESFSSGRKDMTGGFLKVCLSNSADIQGKSKFVELGGSRIDKRRCSDLRVRDLQFTLDQITRDATNDYRFFDLKIVGSILSVNNPKELKARMVRRAISFPIIRAKARRIANRRFGVGSQRDYNALTNGRYKVTEFKSDLVKLKLRYAVFWGKFL